MKRSSGRGFFTAICFTGALLVLQAQVAQAQGVPGDLDPSFGADGRVTTDFGPGTNRASAIAIQTDGKIVAAGSGSNHFALARYNDDGSLDPDFGTGGKVTTSFGARDEAFAVTIQFGAQGDQIPDLLVDSADFRMLNAGTDSRVKSRPLLCVKLKIKGCGLRGLQAAARPGLRRKNGEA